MANLLQVPKMSRELRNFTEYSLFGSIFLPPVSFYCNQSKTSTKAGVKNCRTGA